ncbi:MAG: ABC transporter permease [Ignavibacteriae bacterium]|nr:ABC transporter permease [Ignavibacteriota bacterium]
MKFKRSLAVVLEIVRKEFYQIRQDKRMLGLSIMAPVVQVILLGYAATTDIKNTTMVVCDQDRTAESRAFIKTFTSSGYFLHGYDVTTPDEVDRYIEDARATMALVIPRGFAGDLLTRRTTTVQIVLDGTDANTSNVLLNYAIQIVGTFSQRILLENASAIQGRSTARVLPEPRVWFNPDLKSTNFMVPGVVGLVLMIITMTLTSLGIVKEKEIGTMEQLLVTPIKPYQLIIGKLIPFTIIGFADVLIVLALAHYWFNVPMLGSLPLLFVLSGLFIMTTLGLGLFISTIARTQQQAMLIAQFFFFMPFMFLSGFTFPIANMPSSIQLFTYIIPLRYFLDIVRGIFLKGTGLGELWPQAAALFGLGVVIFSLSVARFQKKLE